MRGYRIQNETLLFPIQQYECMKKNKQKKNKKNNNNEK